MPRKNSRAHAQTIESFSPLAEDLLERLYMRDMEGDATPIPPPGDSVLGELVRHEIVTHVAGEISLTPTGKRHAENAVRRHRLAERLVHDVMDVHGARVDQAACEFEHSLHHGIDEHICALLGHPSTCPHGRPIPKGRCCHERRGAAQAAVVALAEMKGGERGSIAYLSSRQPETMQKLMALGVLPGSAVHVLQTFPSVVFQIGQTQIALDKPLARDIYVRRAGA